MSPQLKLPTIPIEVIAECWVREHPWKYEVIPGDVRFRPTRGGATWPEGFAGVEYLEAVLRVGTPDDMYRFLCQYGDPGSHAEVPLKKVVPSLTVNESSGKFKRVLDGKTVMRWSTARGYMDFSHFRELQQVLRKAAGMPVEKWNTLPIRQFNINHLKVELSYEEGKLTGQCCVHPGVQACAAQLFIEKLSGARYGWCARPDCDEFYRVGSKHVRKFCSQECAHIMAVRASRERKQKRASRKKSS